jgi:dethiobiotin synthetase
MLNGFFITGTDTDVGKTALSALLLAALRKQGLNVAPMKPVQTGCERPRTDHHPASSFTSFSVPDIDEALRLAEMEVSPADYAYMAPYRFEPACSPHLAAERAGINIEIADIIIAARTLCKTYDMILPEGAGGIMVPLNRRELMLDLMHAFGLPVILAARPGLGTLNHTLLSVRALRSDGLNLAGVVVVDSTSAPHTFIETDNLKTIEQVGQIPILGHIPYSPQLASTPYSQLPTAVSTAMEEIISRLPL